MNNAGLDILYEDNHIIVCVKPSGVLSQANGKNLPDMLTILKDYIKEKYSKPGNVFVGLIHRLDLNVGGVMVFAKTSKAASRLSESIRNHQLKKKYFAVIEGYLPKDSEGTFKDYLAKDQDQRIGYVSDETFGKESTLHYKVISNITKKNQVLSLVEVELISGRFHQIRLQFSSRGMPLYGDIKYGSTDSKDSQHLGLYAYRLDLVHPISQEVLTFEKIPSQGIFSEFGL